MASEGSAEQNRNLTNRNRIGGTLSRTSGQRIAKSGSINSLCSMEHRSQHSLNMYSRPCSARASHEDVTTPAAPLLPRHPSRHPGDARGRRRRDAETTTARTGASLPLHQGANPRRNRRRPRLDGSDYDAEAIGISGDPVIPKISPNCPPSPIIEKASWSRPLIPRFRAHHPRD